MLPITNHKVVHVPHALALIAALIGLAAALSWDYHANEKEIPVITKPIATTESSSTHIIDNEEDEPHGGSSQPPGSSGGQAWGSHGVFPLFLPITQDDQ